MKKKNIYIASLLLSGLVSCSQEAPFKIEKEETGKVLTSAFSLEIEGTTPITKALTNGVPSPSDFKVEFFSKNNESQAYRTYDTYGNMPEIVELPAGTYYIKASYGGTYGNNEENAAFNAPYYIGISNDFNVEVDKIVSDIEDVICELSNVRIKVNFDTSLASKMSSDSKVTVRVGGGTPLDYTLNTKEDGFFFLQDGSSTMTATFKGEVEGDNIEEGKTYTDIKNGLYYILTFKLHSPDASDPGNIVPGDGNGGDGLVIDTDVTVADMGDHDITDINPGDDNNGYLEDDMRPENGENSGDTENPGTTPDEGNNNSEEKDPPLTNTLTYTIPPGINEGSSGINYVTEKEGEEGVFLINGLSSCNIHVETDSGIKEFKIYIESDAPGFKETLDEAFGDSINLVRENEGKEGAWDDLLAPTGLPLGVGNQTELDLELANFFSFLSIFKGNHTFTIYIEDNATNKKSIILNINNLDN